MMSTSAVTCISTPYGDFREGVIELTFTSTGTFD
jgi:hypothetical protein